jgi:small subunit ribosomal protein S6
MRAYELTLVVASDTTEDELTEMLSQIQGWVEGSGGKVVKQDVWGRRKLAYQIGQYREGHYVSLDLDLAPNTTDALERNLRLSERVIRHLLVRADQ